MPHGARAVVLGGSIAGLCAAAAVREFFEDVVILERDELPEGTAHRRGAPQSKHPHFLLNAGREALAELFPHVEQRLIDAGAKVLNPALDAAYCEGRGWAPRKAGAMTMLYSSRILLERVLRDSVRELPGVHLREGVSTRGLIVHTGPTPSVGGVRYGPAAGGGDECLSADLVVDAMGRGSSMPSWLADCGLSPPPEQTLNARVMYSSRWYQPPTGGERPADWWWQQLVVLPAPAPGGREEHEYLCTIFPVEGDRWIAFMGSWGHEMPRTSEEFEARAGAVRAPAFAAALARARPTSDVFTTRATSNVWRRYDRLSASPSGLVAMGDAVCAFNPLYGQGMSAAAVSATILRDVLREHAALDRSVLRTFFRRQADYLTIPWSLAVARDRAYEHARGTEMLPDGFRKSLTRRLAWPVFGLISAASREDRVVEHHFGRVFNIQESLTDMLRNPRVLVGLARYQVRSMTGRTCLPPYASPLSMPPATDHSGG
jgi:2-polyprenyl-6-methoxyphenol hydroxylase-like FAD-dependent oxidoreductase